MLLVNCGGNNIAMKFNHFSPSSSFVEPVITFTMASWHVLCKIVFPLICILPIRSHFYIHILCIYNYMYIQSPFRLLSINDGITWAS